MTTDHLGPVPGLEDAWDRWLEGNGFGLGFSVRLGNGRSGHPGTKGDFDWGGWAGTTFWVDPKEELIAVGMIQEPSQADPFSLLMRSLVYQSIID